MTSPSGFEWFKAPLENLLKLIDQQPPDSEYFTNLRPGLVDTPERICRMYAEFFTGYFVNFEEILTFFKEPHDEIIVSKDIDFCSFCEHHMLPFIGKAHVAYMPGTEIYGLSKLARVVDAFARRLQTQERMCNQIADKLYKPFGNETNPLCKANPKGVLVIIEAQHMCQTIRGVKKPNATMVTSAARGTLKQGDAKVEALRLMGL